MLKIDKIDEATIVQITRKLAESSKIRLNKFIKRESIKQKLIGERQNSN